MARPSYTIEKFIEKSVSVHGNIYDYSKSIYTDSRFKIIIICKEHGEFEQKAQNHMNGHGCLRCRKKAYRKTLESFLQDAKRVHGDKYDYSKAVFETAHKKVIIICPGHGEFFQSPNSHTSAGAGCAKCRASHGETLIRNFLNQHGIEYVDYVYLKGCRSKESGRGGILRYDFYVESANLLIEYDGEQHFKPIRLKGMSQKDAEDKFVITQRNDAIKNEFAKAMNIDLLRISHKDIDKIEQILKENLPQCLILEKSQ